MFSHEIDENKDQENRLGMISDYTDLPITFIKGLSEFRFDRDSWYFHCFLIVELLSPKCFTLKSAWDNATKFCAVLEIHQGSQSFNHFPSSSNPESIFKVVAFVPTLRFYLALIQGAMVKYEEASKMGDMDIAFCIVMERFASPRSITGYIHDSILPSTTPSFCPGCVFSTANESFDNATYMKGFDSTSTHLTSTTPIWTEVKQTFVDKLASNFLWYEISNKVHGNDSCNIWEEKKVLIEKIKLDKCNYMFRNFKTDVYAEISKLRPQFTNAQVMGMNTVQFYIEWEKAFVCDNDTMMRLSIGLGLIYKIDLNFGVDDKN